jgi:Protein kinase domain
MGVDEVLVVREFIEGVRFRELAEGPQRPPLELVLRALVDVLSGLSAIHGLRSEGSQGPSMIHGQLTPESIFVTPAGAARVVVASRLTAMNRLGKASYPYLAPELLLEDDEADARSDVYGVGVMLWEALSGKPLFGGMQPSAIVTHLLSGRVTRATTSADASWAAPLADVAARALMPEASKRFQSAAAMAAEIRRAAAGRVGLAGQLASHIGAAHGEALRRRREELEHGRRAPSQLPPAGALVSREGLTPSAATPVTVVELALADFLEEPPPEVRPTPLVPPPFPPKAPRAPTVGPREGAARSTAPPPHVGHPVAPITVPTAFEPMGALPSLVPPAAAPIDASFQGVSTLEPIAAPWREELAVLPLNLEELGATRPRRKAYIPLAVAASLIVVGTTAWLATTLREARRLPAAPSSEVRAGAQPSLSNPAPEKVIAPQRVEAAIQSASPIDSSDASGLETLQPSQPAPPVLPGASPQAVHPTSPGAQKPPARAKRNYDPQGI